MHLPRYEIYARFLNLFLELLTLKLEGFLEVFFWRNEVCLIKFTADTGTLHNVYSIKFRSKHSSNTVLHLLQNLMEQML
jgi:hypothetical protein